VIFDAAQKPELMARLRPLAKDQANPEKAEKALRKLSEPPLSILVISSPKPASIPKWEQELSSGAVCMSLLIAGEAMGYGANWITDWYSVDERALKVLGLGPDEQVAGFIHFGTPSEAPLERVRPDIAALVTYWKAA
jgi:nitroreductase